MKRIFLLILLALPLLALSARAETATETVGKAVVMYGYYGDAASEYVAAALDEAEKADPQLAGNWREIMAYWASLNAGISDAVEDSDGLCIVALGYQLNEDGTMREELVGRLETVLDCRERYPAALILCTGGATAENAPDQTEAGAMKAWLIENGVPETLIFTEERSATTAENAVYSLDILKALNIKRVLMVTSDYHLPRAMLTFEAVRVLSEDEALPEIAAGAALATGTEVDIGRAQAAVLTDLLGYPEVAKKIRADKLKVPDPAD